jgi:hypothetical protein
VPFFEETMAPYFFDEEELKKAKEKEQNPEEEAKEPIWKGIDEKTEEENSKKLVDLDINQEEPENDDENK